MKGLSLDFVIQYFKCVDIVFVLCCKIKYHICFYFRRNTPSKQGKANEPVKRTGPKVQLAILFTVKSYILATTILSILTSSEIQMHPF